MAITHVQSTGNVAATASATTLVEPYSSNVTAGNLLIMFVSWGSTATAPSSVVDTLGNTWTLNSVGVIADAVGTQWAAIYYVTASVGSGANTVTVTWAAGQTSRVISVHEFAGQATTSVVDGTPTGQKFTAAGTTANSIVGSNITTTTNGALIFGACLVHNAASAAFGTGYTEVWHEPGDWLSTEYRIQATAGATAPTWTPGGAGDFLIGAMAFKAAATAGGTFTGTVAIGSAQARPGIASGTGAAPSPTFIGSVAGGSGQARAGTAVVPSALPFITGATGRYLTDQFGAPILIFHDVAWAMPGALSTTEMGTYFADRAARGFNAIETVAIPFWFPSGSYANGTYDGVFAFNSNDVTQPNSTYWARFDSMVASAAANGLTLFIGCAGAPQQFDSSAAEGAWSTAEATSFGTFLGNRYKSASNIVWLFGVDYASADWSTYNPYMVNISNALTAAGDNHLQTIQLHRDNYSDQNTALAGRWDFQTAYSYQAAYKAVRAAYAANVGPVVLIETNYEDENNEGGPGTNAASVRRQLGWTYTSGGVGAGYGRHDIWQMTTGAWPSDLASTWIQPLARIRVRISSLTGWERLVPDTTGTFLTAGAGTDVTSGSQNGSLVDPLETDYATAAFYSGLGVVYVPTTRTITIDKTEINSLSTSYWVDASNASLTATTATFTGNNVTSPGTNAAGDQDWFLIMVGTPLPTNGTMTGRTAVGSGRAVTGTATATGAATFAGSSAVGSGRARSGTASGTTAGGLFLGSRATGSAQARGTFPPPTEVPFNLDSASFIRRTGGWVRKGFVAIPVEEPPVDPEDPPVDPPDPGGEVRLGFGSNPFGSAPFGD